MPRAVQAAFAAMYPAMTAAMPGRQMTIEELVAEGDAVVAWFAFEYTVANGEKIVGRGLTYYRLSDGKIVEDDPFTNSDMAQLAANMQPAAA